MSSCTDKNYKSMKQELDYLQECGWKLYLEGQTSSPKKIAKAQMVAEDDACYMRDYVKDEGGNLQKIEFHYVKYI